MRRRLLTIALFMSERIRMICLALALVVAAKIVGGALLLSVLPPPDEAAATAQP